MVESPVNGAFQLRPKPFNRIGVSIAFDKLIQRVFDVLVFKAHVGKIFIDVELIGANRCTLLHVCRDVGQKLIAFHFADNLCLDIPAALQDADDRRFVVKTNTLHRAFAFHHIRHFATNKSFISLDNAGHHIAAVLHQLANLVTHAVRGFVGDTNLAFKLLCRHAVFGTGHQEHGKKPFLQRRFGFVENRASGRRDLNTAPRAGIGAATFNGVKAIGLATFALAAVRPTRLENEIQTGAVIGKLRVELVNRVFR